MAHKWALARTAQPGLFSKGIHDRVPEIEKVNNKYKLVKAWLNLQGIRTCLKRSGNLLLANMKKGKPK